MDADFFPGGRDVGACRSNVIFHVACAEDATRIDIFETGDHFVRRFARGVDHDVQAAAMAHGHHGFERAVFAGGVQDGIEQRNQRGDAFERKTLGAQVARLQNLFEEVGANQALEDFFLVDFGRGGFETLGDPAAALRLRQVHEIGADSAAIDAARFVGGFAGEPIEVGGLQRFEQAERIERRFQIAPAAEGVENTFALFVARSLRGSNRAGLLGRFRRFCGALFFESCTVCHKSAL